MKIVKLDIVFAGKPRIPVEGLEMPGPSPAPAVNADTVFRRAAIVPISWIEEGAACAVVLEIEAEGPVAGPVHISGHVLATDAGLGNLGPRQIAPANLQDGRTTLRLPLAVGHLAQAGVKEYFVQWEWRCSVGASEFSLGVSDHLLFVTLAPPTSPWLRSHVPETRPFALAVRTACRLGRGEREESRLLSRLLLALRDLEPVFPRLRYSPDVTEYIFRGNTSPQFFDCRDLLTDLWTGHGGEDIELCCTEFACLLVSLANVLGCTTVRAVMQSGADCSTFDSVVIHPLGAPNAHSFEFCHHETCVIRGDAFGPQSLAFDPPFLIHMPTNGAPTPALRPVDGIPLGASTSGVGELVYLPHLIAHRHMARVQTFEVDAPLFQVPDPQLEPGCIPIRYKAIMQQLSEAALPTKLVLDRFRLTGLEPLQPVDWPLRRLPPESSRRRTFFTGKGTTNPLVRVDVWQSGDQSALKRFVAEFVSSREIAYARQDVDGVPTFVSSSGRAAIQLHQGAIVSITRLSDEAPEMPTLAKDSARMDPPELFAS